MTRQRDPRRQPRDPQRHRQLIIDPVRNRKCPLRIDRRALGPRAERVRRGIEVHALTIPSGPDTLLADDRRRRWLAHAARSHGQIDRIETGQTNLDDIVSAGIVELSDLRRSAGLMQYRGAHDQLLRPRPQNSGGRIVVVEVISGTRQRDGGNRSCSPLDNR